MLLILKSFFNTCDGGGADLRADGSVVLIILVASTKPLQLQQVVFPHGLSTSTTGSGRCVTAGLPLYHVGISLGFPFWQTGCEHS